MAKKTKQRKPKKSKKRVPRHLVEAAESRSALSATVAWTLSLMSTLVAEVMGFLSRLYTKLVEPNDLLTVMGAIMLFVALIAGLVTLGLTPVVLKLAKKRPPQVIVQLACVAGALPILVILLQYLS